MGARSQHYNFASRRRSGNLVRGYPTSAGGNDTVARSLATNADSKASTAIAATNEIAAQPSEVVADGEQVFASGNLWQNATGGDLTVPAVINDANMQAAGFTQGATNVPEVGVVALIADRPDPATTTLTEVFVQNETVLNDNTEGAYYRVPDGFGSFIWQQA